MTQLSSMLPKAKWIRDVQPDQPVSDVARKTLSMRLELVWHYLPLSALSAEEDVEYVHQLRVATRRSVAALDIFHELLPERRRTQMARWLKRIRRAAGAARDDDVLLSRLRRREPSAGNDGVGELVRDVQAHRAQAQAPICQVYERLGERRFLHKVEKLIGKIRWRGKGKEPTFRELADAQLAGLVADFRRALSADLSDDEVLHQVRIEGKRLRYAMEVFAGAYAGAFRKDLYPQIEKLQALLGDVNDHATAARRFQSWAAGINGDARGRALESLAGEEDAALRGARKSFENWWSDQRGKRLLQELESCVGG